MLAVLFVRRVLFASSLLVLALTTAGIAEDEGYRRIATPFLKQHCLRCHSGDKPQGEFLISVRTLPDDFGDLAVRARWKEIVNVLNSHSMPPKDEPQPNPREVSDLVDRITGLLASV